MSPNDVPRDVGIAPYWCLPPRAKGPPWSGLLLACPRFLRLWSRPGSLSESLTWTNAVGVAADPSDDRLCRRRAATLLPTLIPSCFPLPSGIAWSSAASSWATAGTADGYRAAKASWAAWSAAASGRARRGASTEKRYGRSAWVIDTTASYSAAWSRAKLQVGWMVGGWTLGVLMIAISCWFQSMTGWPVPGAKASAESRVRARAGPATVMAIRAAS